MESARLKVKDRESGAVVAEWRVSPSARGVYVWSPTGSEICMGACDGVDNRTGLWIYRLGRSEPAKTLDGPIGVGSWVPDGTNVIFCLAQPYFEIWAADIDPMVSAIESLGPARTLEEHFRETVAVWTRRIEANPRDSNAHWRRAGYHNLSHERVQADADMRRWSAIMSERLPLQLQSPISPDLKHVLKDGLHRRRQRRQDRRKEVVGTSLRRPGCDELAKGLFSNGRQSPPENGISLKKIELGRSSPRFSADSFMKAGPDRIPVAMGVLAITPILEDPHHDISYRSTILVDPSQNHGDVF